MGFKILQTKRGTGGPCDEKRFRELIAESRRLLGKRKPANQQEPLPTTVKQQPPSSPAKPSPPSFVSRKAKKMTTQSQSDPVAEFHEAVCQLIDRGVDRRKATSQVAQCNPELHKRFLLATNSDNPATQQDIDDYFAEVTR